MVRPDPVGDSPLGVDAVLEAQDGDYERWRGLDAAGHPVLVERWPGEPERARAAVAAGEWLLGQEGSRAARPRRIDGETLWSTAPPGAEAGAPLHRLDAATTIAALGSALWALHQLPTAGFPVRRPLGEVVELAAARVATGRVVEADLRGPYVRFGPQRLLELARAGLERAGADDSAVVSHGACSMDHLYLDDGRPTAWLRLDAMAVSDRHLDLARLAKEVADRMGPEALPSLFEAYGPPPDVARLDALVLLDELLP